MRALLRQIGDVGGLLGAQAGLPDEGLRMSTEGVALVGHSFGASTVLSAASAIATAGDEAETEAETETESQTGADPNPNTEVAPSLVEGAAATVGAVVVLDPWISGYNCSTDGVAATPTLALMTQSMMYESNADAVGETLGRVAARGETALFAELAESRHQEVSDFPSMIYFLMRASCMAGALPPRRAFCGTLELVVGFLSCLGAAGDGVCAGAGELAAGRMLLRGTEANEGEELAPPLTATKDGADANECCDVLEGCGTFYLHGGSCAPGLEPRVRALVRAAETGEIARDEAARLRRDRP